MDFHFDDFAGAEANATTSSSSGGYTFTSKHASISIIPHFTGLLSVLGSLFIVLDILHPRNRSKKMATVYHRLLLGMSLSDLFSSAAMALSTWPIPQGSKVYAASGNQQTCTAQGFFVQLGTAAPLYNAFLALYYLLMVRYNWSETHGRMIRYERIFHGFAWVLTLGTAFAALGLEQYNSANLWCWIAPLPNDCVTSSKSPDGTTTCKRGDNAWIYRIAFYFIWLWISLIVVTIAMGMVVQAVWSKARESRKYDARESLRASIRRSSLTSGVGEMDAAPLPARKKTAQEKNVGRVAAQAALYVGAFYLTAVFPSIVRMFQAKWNCTSTFYPLSLLTATFYPLQGFWNFFIYVRPKYIMYRKDHPRVGRIRAAAAVLGRTVGLLCGREPLREAGSSSGTTTTTTSRPSAVRRLSSFLVGDEKFQDEDQGRRRSSFARSMLRRLSGDPDEDYYDEDQGQKQSSFARSILRRLSGDPDEEFHDEDQGQKRSSFARSILRRLNGDNQDPNEVLCTQRTSEELSGGSDPSRLSITGAMEQAASELRLQVEREDKAKDDDCDENSMPLPAEGGKRMQPRLDPLDGEKPLEDLEGGHPASYRTEDAEEKKTSSEEGDSKTVPESSSEEGSR